MEKKRIQLEVSHILVSESEGTFTVTVKSGTHEDKATSIELTGLLYTMMECVKRTHDEYNLPAVSYSDRVKTEAIGLLRQTLESVTRKIPEPEIQNIDGVYHKKPTGRKWSEEAKKNAADKRLKRKLSQKYNTKNDKSGE